MFLPGEIHNFTMCDAVILADEFDWHRILLTCTFELKNKWQKIKIPFKKKYFELNQYNFENFTIFFFSSLDKRFVFGIVGGSGSPRRTGDAFAVTSSW